MALYHDYRPDSLYDMIGNKSIVAAIEANVEKEEPPQAYLLAGPSGCGKTTLARIMGEMLGCEDPVEYNSSQLRGIDFMKQFTTILPMRPLHGHRAVYILDECHEMTKSAQEGLLKPLEDTPEHAIIILCTTDPQKLKPAVRNRCVKFEVTTLRDKQIETLMEEVVEDIEEEYDDEVIEKIVELAEGVPREAFSLLESIVGLDDDDAMQVLESTVEAEQQTVELCRALIGKSWKDVSNVLKTLEYEPEKMRLQIMGYCASCLLSTRTDVVPIMEEMKEPFFNTGKNGFVLACYNAMKGKKGKK